MSPGETSFPHRVGRVIRAHGLSGDVLIQLFRPRPIEADQLKYRKEQPVRTVELCFDDGREITMRLVGVRYASPASLVANLEGVDTRESAEKLIGTFVDVDPREGPSFLDEADRVFGALVVDAESGASVGTVEDIRDNGAQAVLVVGHDEVLIPWVDAFVEAVEERDGEPVVLIRPIPGLLEANAD